MLVLLCRLLLVMLLAKGKRRAVDANEDFEFASGFLLDPVILLLLF